MRPGRVIGVDQRRFEIAMAHPLLQRAHRDARCRHPRAKRVPGVVETHLPDACARKRSLKALEKRVAIHRSAGVGIAEYKILVRLEYRLAEEKIKLSAEPIGEGNASG